VLPAKRRGSNAAAKIDPAVHVTRAVAAVPGPQVMPKFVDRHDSKRFVPFALAQILKTGRCYQAAPGALAVIAWNVSPALYIHNRHTYAGPHRCAEWSAHDTHYRPVVLRYLVQDKVRIVRNVREFGFANLYSDRISFVERGGNSIDRLLADGRVLGVVKR